MEDIEDYDEEIILLIKKIEKNLKKSLKDSEYSKNINEGDKQTMLSQIKRNLDGLDQKISVFKSEIYKIPRDHEAKYKQKY